MRVSASPSRSPSGRAWRLSLRGDDRSRGGLAPVLTGTSADIGAPAARGPRRARPTCGRRSPRPTCSECARPAIRPSTRAPRACWARRAAVDGFATAGELALARHDFRARSSTAAGRDARRADPRRRAGRARPLRRGRARAAAMIDRKPNLAGYARVSYLRELRGDLRGRRRGDAAGRRRGRAGAENVAYVSALLGELERRRGRERRGAARVRRALAAVPGFPAAEAGLARLDGGTRAAAARSSSGCPLPEYVIALGEAELAAGGPGRRTLRARLRRAAAARGRPASTRTSSSRSSRPTTGPRRTAVALARRGVRGRAERARRGRARVGADPRRQARGRASGCARRGAAARLGRPAVARPRRTGGARGGGREGRRELGSRSSTASTASRGRRSGLVARCGDPERRSARYEQHMTAAALLNTVRAHGLRVSTARRNVLERCCARTSR